MAITGQTNPVRAEMGLRPFKSQHSSKGQRVVGDGRSTSLSDMSVSKLCSIWATLVLRVGTSPR